MAYDNFVFFGNSFTFSQISQNVEFRDIHDIHYCAKGFQFKI